MIFLLNRSLTLLFSSYVLSSMFSGDKNSEKQINDYLGRLDKALSDVPAGARADIIVEMRENIRKAKETNPQMSCHGILEGLGEPEQLANHYLMGRGLQLQRPPKHSHFKWMVIGILGTLGLIVAFISFMAFLFTPLLKVDETTGRVQIFGGLFDIQAKNVITQLSKDGSFVFGSISGVQALAPEIRAIEIRMGSGEIRVDYSEGQEINWDCDGAGKDSKTSVDAKTETMVLDFSSAFVDCDINLPEKPLNIIAIAGEVTVRNPRQPLSIKLERGSVEIAPDPETPYKYDLKAAEEVSADEFLSSESPQAVPISIQVIDGEISKLDQ